MFKAKPHIPLILSLLCPGIGQFVQRRWISGLFYLLVFLALAISMIAVVVRMMDANMDAAMAFMNNEPNKEFAADAKQTVLWLIGGQIVVYLAGVIDTYRAFKRQLEKNIRARLIGS